jgi:ribosome-binding factor A
MSAEISTRRVSVTPRPYADDLSEDDGSSGARSRLDFTPAFSIEDDESSGARSRLDFTPAFSIEDDESFRKRSRLVARQLFRVKVR